MAESPQYIIKKAEPPITADIAAQLYSDILRQRKAPSPRDGRLLDALAGYLAAAAQFERDRCSMCELAPE